MSLWKRDSMANLFLTVRPCNYLRPWKPWKCTALPQCWPWEGPTAPIWSRPGAAAKYFDCVTSRQSGADLQILCIHEFLHWRIMRKKWFNILQSIQNSYLLIGSFYVVLDSVCGGWFCTSWLSLSKHEVCLDMTMLMWWKNVHVSTWWWWCCTSRLDMSEWAAK